ncbi:hypothetical protein M404DRAFT_1001643 [Pisolithus tinctorius Marx 270]|uniref:Uncharacterized protein n=1 Tax=Pisolithus tinctorius Marx 270 TaxID=870435 RepID=A0A0C3NQ66_PISTI|nr:hypothetical protein M404DRAFT_1001643 [Pisolithus tinctorius Marx 270]
MTSSIWSGNTFSDAGGLDYRRLGGRYSFPRIYSQWQDRASNASPRIQLCSSSHQGFAISMWIHQAYASSTLPCPHG